MNGNVLQMRKCTLIEGKYALVDPWRFNIQRIMFHNRKKDILLFSCVTDLFERTFKIYFEMGFAVTNYYLHIKEKNMKQVLILT